MLFVWGSTSYKTLSAFRTATGQEQHGVQADPLFVSATVDDFHLLEGSPAIDSADSSAPGEQTADFAGAPRVDDPATVDTGVGPRSYDDRGAYEFQPTSSPFDIEKSTPGNSRADLREPMDGGPEAGLMTAHPSIRNRYTRAETAGPGHRLGAAKRCAR